MFKRTSVDLRRPNRSLHLLLHLPLSRLELQVVIFISSMFHGQDDVLEIGNGTKRI